MKKDKKTRALLKRLAAVRGSERELMPRPAVFKDLTKYSRARAKAEQRKSTEDKY